jgi:hypothetical protein
VSISLPTLVSRWPRQVPWMDWNEWNLVYRGLFASETELLQQKRKAVALVISVWRLRGKVPHSAEMSALLVDLLLKDESLSDESSAGRVVPHPFHLAEMDLRLQYSIIIIRAVNGLVDDKQQSAFAESVSMIGIKIGMIML